MAEGTFTQSINQAVRRFPPAYAWKISDKYTAGVPDAYYSGNKADLWVEYKWTSSLPKKADVKPTLSELQKDWLRQQFARGRDVAVIVGSPQGCIIYEGLDWENPVPATPDNTLTKKKVIEWLVQKINRATK